MSETPSNLAVEQLNQDIKSARHAAVAAGDYLSVQTSTGRIDGIDQPFRDHDHLPLPRVEIKHSSDNRDPRARIDARHRVSAADVGGNTTTYHAAHISDPDSGEGVGKTTITRQDAAGEDVYNLTLRNPQTAMKFGSLIARQIATRSESKQSRAA